MPVLPEGTMVTIQRNCADYIVTGYGITHLKGKTLRQRAQELIFIAHPGESGPSDSYKNPELAANACR